MNLDMPLDEIVSLNRKSSQRGGGDRRGERGQGRVRGRGRGMGRGRGRNANSLGGATNAFISPTWAPLLSRSSGSSFSNDRASASFLRPKRPSASHIAKSFISRRPKGWRPDLFEDAVGNALGIDTGAKLFISNLEYGVSNEDIEELFSEMGTVKHCGVHYDRGGRSIGTADVVYLRKADAITAINRYNNVQLDGKPMKIELVGTNLITSSGRAAYGHALLGRAQPSLPINGAGVCRKGSGIIRFRTRGRGSGRGWGSGRGSGNVRGRGRVSGKRSFTEVKKAPTAEDLDADLEKYHKDAMQMS